MLLNFASDIPFAYKDNQIIFLDRKNLENQLAVFLKNNFENNIFIINWPWYFSATRIWVETINILKFLKKIENIYFLNKLDFFRQNNIYDIYLFSGNKNKYIHLKENDFSIVLKQNLDSQKKSEQLFEQENNLQFINYETILKNYKNLNWENTNILKPYYVFKPIVC